ncbi:MAG: hypothetical protein JWM91_1020, partial [Rhodospirillales bacterium]|nr:hypothetical protein [Rhodospirillales bacterium]
MVDRGRGHQHPLPPGLALDPGRGLVRADHGAGADGLGDPLGGNDHRRLGAGHDIGDGAFADGDTEHLVHQPDQTREADRLGDVQMQDQGRQTGAERGTRRHPVRRRRAEPLAAVRTGSAMAMNPGHHRLDRWQFDMIVRVKLGLIVRRQSVIAVRAGLRPRLDHAIGVLAQRPRHARMPLPLRRP